MAIVRATAASSCVVCADAGLNSAIMMAAASCMFEFFIIVVDCSCARTYGGSELSVELPSSVRPTGRDLFCRNLL